MPCGWAESEINDLALEVWDIEEALAVFGGLFDLGGPGALNAIAPMSLGTSSGH